VSKLTAFWRGWVSLSQDFRGRDRPWEIFFGFYKTRHILLSDNANCTVLRAVVLTQYRHVTDRQTDRQTDGIVIASTALAMRALRRTVKYEIGKVNYSRVLEKSLMYVLYYTVFQKNSHFVFYHNFGK